MKRRNFLQIIAGLFAAPALVKSSTPELPVQAPVIPESYSHHDDFGSFITTDEFGVSTDVIFDSETHSIVTTTYQHFQCDTAPIAPVGEFEKCEIRRIGKRDFQIIKTHRRMLDVKPFDGEGCFQFPKMFDYSPIP